MKTNVPTIGIVGAMSDQQLQFRTTPLHRWSEP